MPTPLSRRSGAVYGEKSPKTRLARIYCYGITVNIVNMIHLESDVFHGSLFKASAFDAIVPGFEPRRDLLFFFKFTQRGSVTDFWRLF